MGKVCNKGRFRRSKPSRNSRKKGVANVWKDRSAEMKPQEEGSGKIECQVSAAADKSIQNIRTLVEGVRVDRLTRQSPLMQGSAGSVEEVPMTRRNVGQEGCHVQTDMVGSTSKTQERVGEGHPDADAGLVAGRDARSTLGPSE